LSVREFGCTPIMDMTLRRLLAAPFDCALLHDVIFAMRRALRVPLLTTITYHRLQPAGAALSTDEDVVDTTPEGFERQIVDLARHFSIVGLEELRGWLAGRPLPASSALITFDDGYRDCHDVALPILLRHGIKAVFFVTTGYVTDRRVFWWDRIAWLLKNARRRRFVVPVPPPLAPVIVDLDQRARAQAQLLRLVKQTQGLDLEALLASIAVAGDAPWDEEVERRLSSTDVMTWDHVRALARAGMDVGSHTRTHRVLQTLPADLLAPELFGSRQDLERELGRRVVAVAYPVGRPVARFPAIRSAVAAAGYDLGFSYNTGVQPLWGAVDPLDLRRLAIDSRLTRSMYQSMLALPSI
jgi:peptidoglycan/xylan/chitin deacetylase (PgdA/CDA1 family)